MGFYSGNFTVLTKDDGSPVTEVDLRANEVIVNGLHDLTPSIPILSEESAETFKGVSANSTYWLVDPLDGTKEFLKKNGEFTVNIALVCEGRVRLGVVYAPSLQILYAAAGGVGAFKEDENGRHQIGVRKRQSNTPWRVAVSRSHADETLTDWLKGLGESLQIGMGSSLKICLVAEGVADLYPRLGRTCFWDTAAGQCVLEEAGGALLKLNGSPLQYHLGADFFNPHFVACGDPAAFMAQMQAPS